MKYQSVELVRVVEREYVPWSNGAGLTAPIAVGDVVGGLPQWRVSVARLGSVPSEFSTFRGTDRIFTVVGRYGVEFDWGSSMTKVDPWQPFSFDGALNPWCVPEGETSAFNVMTDPSRACGSVVMRRPGDGDWMTDPAAVTVVLVRDGQVCVDTRCAAAGDCVVVRHAAVRISGTASVLVAVIRASVSSRLQ
ncbi:environmental stress-induced protein Ves [Rhodococcus sp. 27YEA15]|uniref:HutD family protein n=1 Tax=Rhodococcus sp. 27YEA15 TaxID=3156259 RepID=UPI003C7E4DB2